MKCKLRDICTKIGSGATPKGGKESYRSNGVSLIRSQNVLDFSFSKDGLAHINDNQANQLRNVIVEPEDVLLNITGDSVARTCMVPSEVLPARVNQHVAIVRPDYKKADSRFMLYFLQSIKPYLLQIASAGATRNALTKGMIEELELDLPSLSEQLAVSNILSALDMKISVNKKINHHLVQMAQAIYADFIASVAGSTTKLKELCTFQEGYVNPSQSRAEYFDGTVKWLRAVDINESFIFDTSRTLTDCGFESAGKSAYLFKPNTIVISKSGTIGRLGFVADFMCGNRAVINIAPNDPRILPFIYLFLKSRQREYPDLAVGSVQKNLYVPILQELDILVPKQGELLDLCESVTPLFEQWKNNVAENRSLSQTRDALLPRLMSGELSVVDLDAAK